MTKQRTMADTARVALQEAIISGELEPGAALRLEPLAEKLGMSISPIREAIRQLEQLGIATLHPHRGAYVTELTGDDLRDTYEARLAIEPRLTRRAAERFTDEDAEAARDNLEAYELAQEIDFGFAAREAHEALHFGIYAASGLVWLQRLVRPVFEAAERYRLLSLRDGEDRLKKIREEHESIIQACITHSPEAAEAAMHDHLVSNANHVAASLGWPDLF
jgi:DNA-binding GntR family transcriptional regulator